MNDEPTIKVTRLGDGWGVRCIDPSGRIISEGKAEIRTQIGPVARNLLRWYDKLGGGGNYAHRARHRAWEKARECRAAGDLEGERLRNLDMVIR